MFRLNQGTNNLQIFRDLLKNCIVDSVVLLRFTDTLTKKEKYCEAVYFPPLNSDYKLINLSFDLISVAPTLPTEINLFSGLPANQTGRGVWVLEVFNTTAPVLPPPNWDSFLKIYKDFVFNPFVVSDF